MKMFFRILVGLWVIFWAADLGLLLIAMIAIAADLGIVPTYQMCLEYFTGRIVLVYIIRLALMYYGAKFAFQKRPVVITENDLTQV